MNRKTFDYKIIDELAKKYTNTDALTNKALKTKYKNELAAVLLSDAFIVNNDKYVKIYEPNKKPHVFNKNEYGQYIDLIIDSYHDLIISTISNYNSTKGITFRTYFYNSLQYIIKTFYTKLDDRRKKDNANKSIDITFNDSEKEKSEYTDLSHSRINDDIYDLENENAELIVFTSSCIFNFLNCNSKKNNETRKMYFKLFNTDIVVQFVIDLEKINTLLLKHEQMILSSINLDFLNFFMANNCENISHIIMCPLKKLKDLLIDVDDDYSLEEICPLPLPTKVYISYLKIKKDINVSKVLISQQKSNFHNYMNEFRSKQGEVCLIN